MGIWRADLRTEFTLPGSSPGSEYCVGSLCCLWNAIATGHWRAEFIFNHRRDSYCNRCCHNRGRNNYHWLCRIAEKQRDDRGGEKSCSEVICIEEGYPDSDFRRHHERML